LSRRILTVLQAEPGSLTAAATERDRSEPVALPFLVTFLFFVILMFVNVGRGRRVRRYRRGIYVGGLGGFGGGGFGGGGFGGGGGGFGGGGASGGWLLASLTAAAGRRVAHTTARMAR